VNAQDKNGETALMGAVNCYPEERSAAIVSLLLDHGANANTKDRYDNTALSSAVYYGYRQGRNDKVVLQLLAHGADPNLAHIDGKSLLGFIEQRRLDFAALLKQYGARK
jgi:ankyrin repeat protein